MSPSDPYVILGVAANATDEEVRSAYRRLAMAHHPDHNGGSPESAVRFAEIQEAYADVRLQRRTATRPTGGGNDPELETRIAQMEQELARARELRERAARRAERLARARHPTTPSAPPRPSDEELGYVSTDDSFSKILDDFADQVADRVAERPPPRRPRHRSVADWIDELGSRLTGEDR